MALTRLSPAAASEEARGAEAAALAPLVGMGAYELRIALGGGVPLVVSATADAQLARDLVSTLRGRGHGAIGCDDARVEGGEQMFSPRDFALEAECLSGESNGGVRAELPWASVLAIIVATHVRREATTVETSKKSFSLGRAAMSGGLILNKTTTTTDHRTHEDREPVAYLVHRQGHGHWLLAESRLRYTGLGAGRAPAAHDNFRALLTELRRRVPNALYDDRLMRQKRAASTVAMRGAAKARTLASSNAAETDLAVHLIALAHLQGQL